MALVSDVRFFLFLILRDKRHYCPLINGSLTCPVAISYHTYN
jgi:hypothetical protein